MNIESRYVIVSQVSGLYYAKYRYTEYWTPDMKHARLFDTYSEAFNIAKSEKTDEAMVYPA